VNGEYLVGIVGIILILAVAVAISSDRRGINLRIIGSAFLLQVSIAAFALCTPVGQSVLGAVSSAVQSMLDYSNAGISFLFSDLAGDEFGFVFAVRVLPVIIFVSSLISVLYYFNVMPFLINTIGRALKFLLGINKVESMVASANIFLDQTQSSLVVRPYLEKIDRAHLFTIMCSGLTAVSGAVLAGFASIGVQVEYLVAAAFMAAPAGVLMAKIIMPSQPGEDIEIDKEQARAFGSASPPANVVEAAANGAMEGVRLAAAIGGLLIAFVSLIAMLNGIFSGVGELFGISGLTLDWMMGQIFSPLMYVLGVPWEEAHAAGNLIGQKLVLNEFIAFVNFMESPEQFSAHTQVVITFALCGFSNFSAFAILLGGLGSLVPQRRSEIARMGLKAIAAGTLANLMSAAIASTLLSYFTVLAP
jgi:concentrative nucleoside transporter, CNT family